MHSFARPDLASRFRAWQASPRRDQTFPVRRPRIGLIAGPGRRGLPIFRLLLNAVVSISLGTVAGRAADELPPADHFQQRVKPILVGRCLECHGASAKGDLDLRTAATLRRGGESGKVVEPGEPDESLLILYVDGEDMPPGKPLTAEEKATLRQWVERGGFFPDETLDPFALTTDHRAGYDWWALQKLASPEPPAADGSPEPWAEHPIDRFVYARLRQEGLQPAPPADRRTLIRRATYDLIGLPPTWEEIRAFEQDPRDDAYAHLIERLLDSPHYGQRWGRHWLDVVRFGESNGFERNQIIDNAWPFRDYVIRSLNEDKPYDQLVREHLAGDQLAPGNRDVEVGTAFLVCGPYDDVGNQDPEQAAQIRANTIDEIIRATSEAFLGLTVGCARCHDHKFDPITQHDYYALYATFAGVHHGSRVVATQQERQRRSDQLAPLVQREEELERQRVDLERALEMLAEEQAAAAEAEWTRPPVNRRGVEEVFDPIDTRYVRLTVQGTDTDPVASAGYRIDEFEVWTDGPDPRNVALASQGAVATGASPVAEDFADAYSASLAIDGRFGAPWIAAGPELVIQLARPQTIRRVVFSSDRTGVAGDQPLATFVGEYQLAVSADGEAWQEVASSATRQPVAAAHRKKRLIDRVMSEPQRQQLAVLAGELREIRSQKAAVEPLPNWWLGDFRPAEGPFQVFLGGDPRKRGDQVVSRSIAALDRVVPGYQLDASAPEATRRLRLADWIASRDNPLTARVMANRLWHYHFGTGIVDTPSDFGFMGGRSTHPELLDYLACELQRRGWSWKEMHRLIMLSRTYQQASLYDEGSARADAASRLLWRFPPRRLSAEELRDTLLSVSGRLDPRSGGPGFRLYRYMQDNVATYVPLDRFGPETYRRSVYHQNARATQIDLMTDFDTPDCAFATPRRASTTTPLQALTLMNHSFTLDMAGALAERAASVARHDSTDQSPPAAADIQALFRRVLAREPDETELAAAGALRDRHGMVALCRALLNTNELIYVD